MHGCYLETFSLRHMLSHGQMCQPKTKLNPKAQEDKCQKGMYKGTRSAEIPGNVSQMVPMALALRLRMIFWDQQTVQSDRDWTVCPGAFCMG